MTRAKGRFQVRENNRHGTSRDPVGSTISTPPNTAPLESRRQRRALRGPKNFRTAVVSTVRDAWAGPTTVGTRKRATRVTPRGRVYTNPAHRDPDAGRFTTNLGGSCAPRYVPGRG